MKKLFLLFLLSLVGCFWQKVVIQPLPEEDLIIEAEITSLELTPPVIPEIPAPPVQFRNTPPSTEVITKIVVSIPEQRLYAYQGDKIIKEIIVSTAKGPNFGLGQDSEMPHNHLGCFSVIEKDIDHWSAAYDCPMPYAMKFYGGHYIHATTPDNYRYLGSPASHGCVRTNLDDAKWLFERTFLGTPVVITNSEINENPLKIKEIVPIPQESKKIKRPDLTRIN